MRVRDIMTRPVVTTRPDASLRDAITALTEHGFAGLPVVDDLGQVVGILSESDALRAGTNDRAAVVASAMTTPVEVVKPDADVSVVAERMLEGRLRCMPVVEVGLLVGVVARRDLLRTMVRDDDMIAAKIRAHLDDYAGSRRQWTVDVNSGHVVISGSFADDAEQHIVNALAQTVPGVVSTDVRTVPSSAHGRDA